MKPARDPKPGPIKSVADAAERRRAEAADNTAQRREASIRTKRLRRAPSAPALGLSRHPSAASLPEAPGPEAEAYAPQPAPQDIDERVQAAVAAIKSAAPVGSPAHLDAVRTLRQLLSDYEDPPYLAVLAAGGVPALTAALQPHRGDAFSLETVFEAAWALTNLAVGDPQVVKALVPSAPLLIAHLGDADAGGGRDDGLGLMVAEQTAWALGNIAGDDAEHRATLVANGAVPPLAALLSRGVYVAAAAGDAAADVDLEISTGGTAAWALSNLLRGAGASEVAAFMAALGAPEALVAALRVAPPRLLTEAGWVLAYVTAGPDIHLNRLVGMGVVEPLCRRIEAAVEGMLSGEDEGSGDDGEGDMDVDGEKKGPRVPAALTPLLRALGNIAAGAGRAGIEALLSSDAAPTLKAVVVCAESERHHGLQREAAWVLASLAGAPGRAGVDALRAAGALPALMALLKRQPFHVRKEAAYALANVGAGGGGASGDGEALNSLFGGDIDAVKAILSLMRSADADAAKLGLQFAEMLMRTLPNGAALVEAADGIDAIEAVQFGASGVGEDLQAAAAALVDRYWGAEGGAAEER